MAEAKIVVVPTRSIADSITLLLQDREELQWMVAIGRAKNGDLIFYDNSEEGIGSQILSRLSKDSPPKHDDDMADEQGPDPEPLPTTGCRVVRLDSGDAYGRRPTFPAALRRPSPPTYRRSR